VSHVVTHGTVNEYANYGCRCEKCRAAYSEYQGERRRHQIESGAYGVCERCGESLRHPETKHLCRPCYDATRPEAPHGSESRYERCDCDECREAAAGARKARRHREAGHCENCGGPRRSKGRPGADSGLCRECWIESRRKVAA
jgi:hypothetical protein